MCTVHHSKGKERSFEVPAPSMRSRRLSYCFQHASRIVGQILAQSECSLHLPHCTLIHPLFIKFTSDSAEALDIVVEFINSESYEEAYLSSSILWALAPATSTRSTITALGAIKKLLSLLKRTLAVRPCDMFPDQPTSFWMVALVQIPW